MTDMDALRRQCSELKAQLERAHAEVEYYKNLSAQTGRKRLREVTQLSNLLLDMKEEKKRRDMLEAEMQQAKEMEAIGVLASGVAHDLNNILGAIVGYPDLILHQLSEDSSLRKYIIAMKDSGKKAAAMVHDLLTLAKRGKEKKFLVNINTVISDYFASPEFEKLKEFHPDVAFLTQLDAALPSILGSPIHLSKIIMNLVSNASEAMPDGGDLVITSQHRQMSKARLFSGVLPPGDYVVLEIMDTGVGISPEDMKKIFEPFFTKKVLGRSGTGLGMTVVWATVKNHRAHIDVKSEPGKGTRFDLYFPVAEETSQVKQTTPSSIQPYEGHGENLLVVDDVEAQRQIAVSMLSKLGYEVAAVASGEDAVRYVRKNSVHLLVLDMIMEPGMDGLETYKEILKIKPDQKAIIVSGFSETDQTKQAQTLGAGAFIRKPYLFDQIARAVKKELSGD